MMSDKVFKEPEEDMPVVYRGFSRNVYRKSTGVALSMK
jgi:hypothetical protein